MDEPILDYLRRKLKEAGPGQWPQIVAAANASMPDDKAMTTHSLRKLAYGDRTNPGLTQVQALLDIFRASEDQAA
jgi:hypothetical protein